MKKKIKKKMKYFNQQSFTPAQEVHITWQKKRITYEAW